MENLQDYGFYHSRDPKHDFRSLTTVVKMSYMCNIDQVLGRDGWVLAKFFRIFMDRDEGEVHNG